MPSLSPVLWLQCPCFRSVHVFTSDIWYGWISTVQLLDLQRRGGRRNQIGYWPCSDHSSQRCWISTSCSWLGSVSKTNNNYAYYTKLKYTLETDVTSVNNSINCAVYSVKFPNLQNPTLIIYMKFNFPYLIMGTWEDTNTFCNCQEENRKGDEHLNQKCNMRLNKYRVRGK